MNPTTTGYPQNNTPDAFYGAMIATYMTNRPNHMRMDELEEMREELDLSQEELAMGLGWLMKNGFLQSPPYPVQ